MANLDSIAMLAELDGILLVDKPALMATHDLVKAVKTHFNLVKIGHAGTLEPNATGILVLLVGDATRISNDMMARDKAYEATVTLGITTDTFDGEGHILKQQDATGIKREQLDAVLGEFRGDIFQTTPPFSVIKRLDQPNYDIVATPADEVVTRLEHVYRLVVTAFEPPRVTFEMLCGKGVSARVLAHDLGQMLGCGATLQTLRRTQFGKFKVSQAIPFMDLMKLDAVGFKERVLPRLGALG